MTGASRSALIEKLLEPAAYPHPVGPIKLIETPISWVFLTGPFAYKVKKPCKLEFLDFSTLDRRCHFCAEEIRLNRRFAPELYLAAVPITGCPQAPHVDGLGASDIAFLTMDLESRGRPDLAAQVTSAWMEAANDHSAAAVLPVHRVARAVVRAAVAAIRSAQGDCPPEAAAAARRESDRYLDLAERLAAPAPPLLLATTGVSGAGKSTLAAECVGVFGAVRLRSDVERKRLFALAATDRRGDALTTVDLYGEETTRQVYQRLSGLAHELLEAGASVVVDATCQARFQRDLLAAVARDCRAQLVWLDLDLPADLLCARVAARARFGRDPSDATPETVLAQLASREPIGADELVAAPGGVAPLHVRVGADELAAPARFLGDLARRLPCDLPGSPSPPALDPTGSHSALNVSPEARVTRPK